MVKTAVQNAPPTVWVVDADPAVRDGLRLLLQTRGVVVRGYGSGEALLANPNGALPLCIIADVRLPGISGLELMRRLREEQRPVPFILLSSESDVALAVDAMRQGALDFIEKPSIDVVVLQQIERLIGPRAR